MNYRVLIFSFSVAFFLNQNQGFAQSPNYSEDVATILYNNCTQCHNSGGVAPFPLVSYQDAVTNSASMFIQVSQRIMPPWPPNNDYAEYAHDRTLTQAEINTITTWINNGVPRGDSTLAPCPPNFSEGSFLGIPDLQLTIPKYKSKATSNFDDYVCFSLPTGLTVDRFVEAVEIVPGNREIVHHVIMYIDPSGTYPTDTTGRDCTGPNGNVAVLGAYTPGGLPVVFPNGNGVKMGVKIPAGANIVLAMHYPNGSNGLTDSTAINLFFYPTGAAGVREVTVAPVGFDLGFCVPANQTRTITDNNTIPLDISVLSVNAHMHLLGSSLRSFAITPINDTIHLLDIPSWNFEWQDFYTFKNIIKIPAGSVVYSSATYDNTTDNPYNPNNPPQQVCGGLNTTDEMFIVSLQFTPYFPGDENISLEELLAPPEPTASAVGSSNICNGNQVTLTADAGFASYRWCPSGETTQSILVNSPGQYYVEVKDAKGISGSSNTVVITEGNPSPPVVADQILCVGNNVTLTASGGSSYSWSTGATGNAINVSPVSTTIYSVTSTDGGGCTASTDVTVTVNDNPIVNIADEIFCQGENVTLDAGAGFAYNWSTGVTTQTIMVSTTDTYAVTITDGNGCTATDAGIVVVNPLPIAGITGNQAICDGETTQLIATGGTGFIWNTGSNNSSIMVTPQATNNYSVTVSDANNCSATTSVTVEVNDNPVTNLQDVTICSGSITTLDAENPGATYLWSNNTTGQTIMVGDSGIYSITVTDANNCVGTGQAIVSLGAGLTVNIADKAACFGETITLNAGHPGSTYNWSTNAASQSIQVTSTGTYNVTVTDANNCVGLGSSSVTINSLPNTSFEYDTTICAGEIISINATNGFFKYRWNTGDTTSLTTVNPTSSTVYSVTVTDNNSCSATANFSVEVEICLGIKEQGAFDITIYPNPSSGQLFFEAGNAISSEFSLIIRDVVGRPIIIETGTLINSRFLVDLSAQAKGIYFVEIVVGDKRVVEKVMVY